jgi:hypothetical protein
MAEPEMRRIPAEWLVERVAPEAPGFEHYRELFATRWQPGDELWHYDEPAPPGVNAGELGIALVRCGVPIHAVVLGVH